LDLGTSLIAGSLTLVMMTLPTIIRTTQESLKTVPQSYREGSLALGSGKWHMIRTVVLPSSIDGIVTGCILAIGRIVGESAVLMFTAGMGMRMANFGGDTIGEFFSNFFGAAGSTLTVSLYVYAKERADFDEAFAVAVVLLVIAFAINLAAKFAGKKLKKN
ncbi:MAG TPA: ABC transporter permease subunit, partial [Candidatus Scatomorpha stercoravium]|nr:ABC transporter permease subunit [Candidatus Scatomorpha stercoravium]